MYIGVKGVTIRQSSSPRIMIIYCEILNDKKEE